MPGSILIGWVLLHFLWQGTVLAIVTCVGCFALKRSSANARYLFLCAVLLTCGMCPLLTYLWLDNHGFPFEQSPVTSDEMPASSTGSVPIHLATYSTEQIDCSPITGPSLNYVKIGSVLYQWLPFITQIWLLGVTFHCLRLALDYVRLKRLTKQHSVPVEGNHPFQLAQLAVRMGIKETVSLIESSLVEIPSVVGWLKPVLIVPATFLTSLPPEQIEAIFAHELAHVRRYDNFVNFIQLLIETFLFYHPAIWWIGHLIREERENCCDDIAIAIAGDRVTYVTALATLEQARVFPRSAAVAANGGSLLKRVQRVFGEKTPFSMSNFVQENYKQTVTSLLAVGGFCGICFMVNQGTVTRHVDTTYLTKALVAASQDGDLATMRMLLGRGIDPNLIDRPTGNNALLAAVINKHPEAIRLLIGTHAHVDDKNTSGFRAIDWALAKGDLTTAILLRRGGASISFAGWSGAIGNIADLQSMAGRNDLKGGALDDAMRNAVSMGHLSTVQYLEGISGQHVDGKFLTNAASSGNIAMMAYILKQGATIKVDGARALEEAVVRFDQPESAKFLLARGANPNLFTRWHRFVLSQAKSARMVGVLLDAGADPNAADAFGNPLSSAANAECVRLLIAHGAGVKQHSEGSNSLVESAIIHNRVDKLDVIQELVRQGANLNLRGNGVAALAMAAERNDLETENYLLHLGVDPNSFVNQPYLRSSALCIASMVSSLDGAKILVTQGGLPHGSSLDDNSPLSLALVSGDGDLVNLLLKAGARDVGDLSVAAALGDIDRVSALIDLGIDVNEPDENGNTPLFYAMERDRPQVTRLLLQHGASLNVDHLVKI